MKHKQSLNRPTLIGLRKICARYFLRALVLSMLLGWTAWAKSANGAAADTTTELEAGDKAPRTNSNNCISTITSCSGSADVNYICNLPEEPQKPANQGESTNNSNSTSSTANASTSAPSEKGSSKAKKTCGRALTETETCCAEPTTCLGGQSLATLEQVNNVVTMAGPGVGSMLTGFGKDMSGMCKMIQGLAGSGAALALAAKTKCTAKIASCKGTCNNEIKRLCGTYEKLRGTCKIEELIISSPHSPQLAYNKLSKQASPIAQEICRADNNKNKCKRQSAKAKDWGTKMGQMANSALSAELCKRQAGLVRDKEECKRIGGTWKDGECIPPEEDTRIAQCTAAGGTWIAETEKCRHKPPPNPNKNKTVITTNNSIGGPPLGGALDSAAETAPEDTITEENKSRTPGGGGGDPKNTAGRNGIDMPETSENDYLNGTGGGDSTSANNSLSASGSGGKGFRGFGRGGRGFKRNKGKKDDEDPNNYNMKGGFSGYAGGGRGDDEDFADLKLSKKKLDELEKKKGAMRKTASEGLGGAHENIFERITRRFKALCQKDIDCH